MLLYVAPHQTDAYPGVITQRIYALNFTYNWGPLFKAAVERAELVI